MRLIVCDRCGVKGKLVPDTIFGTKGEGFGSLHPDGDAPTVELCPACVKRALEKPERDPVLAATDLPDVPMERAPPGTVDALLHGKDIVKLPPENPALNCAECGAFAHAHDIGRDHRFRKPA